MLIITVVQYIREMQQDVISQEMKRLEVEEYTMEQIYTAKCEKSATMLIFTLAMAIWFAIWEKRKSGYEIFGTVIGIAGIVFAMSAPGNDERTIMEAENWMPEFFDLNILEKARLCAVFVFEHFVAIPDVIFFLFSLLVAYEGIKVAQRV